METYEGETSLAVYYKEGSKIAEPGKSASQFKEVTLKGYSLVGWYVAETDENGVVTDEDGTPQASSHQFDFSSERVSESITLVAVFGRNITVVYRNLRIYGSNANEYQKSFGVSENATRPAFPASYASDHTGTDDPQYSVEGYYWNYDETTKTYSDLVTFPILHSELDERATTTDDGPIVTIYTKLSEKAIENN
jgi:hypothetical protein